MGATPIYSFPWPEDTDDADGPAALSALATAFEGVLADSTLAGYTPDWLAIGSVQPSGASFRSGWYVVDRGVCTVGVAIIFGSSVNGGRQDLRVGLPVPQRADITEQVITCKTYIPGVASFAGPALITSNVMNYMRPMFPNTNAESEIGFWRNSDSSGAVSTGFPQIGGKTSVQPGGNFFATGSYLV